MKKQIIILSSSVLSGLLALVPYVLANMYLTLILNWPGVAENLGKVNIDHMKMMVNINFMYCLYALAGVVIIVLRRFILAAIVYTYNIIGFLVGIALIYSVAIVVQPLVSNFITATIIVNAIIAIYAMIMFHGRMMWRYLQIDKPCPFSNSIPPNDKS